MRVAHLVQQHQRLLELGNPALEHLFTEGPMLYVEKSTVIPAWSEMEIMGTTKEIALEEGIWMIERAVLSSGLITARAVVKSQSNGGVPLRVMNLSQDITLLHSV